MAIEYPNGAGQALGDILATCAPLRLSGSIWYVNSATGTDGASPAGKDDKKPLATLKQAITNATDEDVIVLMDGHTETSTADSDWDCGIKRLTIVGAGLSGGYPTAKLTCGNVGSLGGPITFGAQYSSLRNVWVTERAATNANPRVVLNATNVNMIGCYVPCGAPDTGAGVSCTFNGGNVELRNCTFVSTAVSTAAQPLAGVKTTVAIGRMRLDGCVFDAGTVGFSGFWALDANAGKVTHLEGESVSLLRGADMRFESTSGGWLNAQTATGGSRVDW